MFLICVQYLSNDTCHVFTYNADKGLTRVLRSVMLCFLTLSSNRFTPVSIQLYGNNFISAITSTLTRTSFFVFFLWGAEAVNIPYIFPWSVGLFIRSTRLFIWSTRLFIWSTKHFLYGQLDFLYGQLNTFYMVN